MQTWGCQQASNVWRCTYMLCCKFRFLNIIFGLISLVCAASTQAGVTVIVSAPPPSREIVVGPPGYKSCYVVQQGFYNGVWQHKHRVCEYEGNNGSRMWVNGYWQCGSYRAGGICTGWHWIGSHWASRRDMDFYRRPSNRNYHRHHGQVQVQINEHEERNSHQHGHDNRHGHR